MTTGYYCIYITPKRTVIEAPEEFDLAYESDPLPEPKTVYEDRLVDFDHEPDASEIAAEKAPNETVEELRQWSTDVPDTELWRLRLRYPVTIVTEPRGGIVHLYRLGDPKIPASWGNAADFWGVLTSGAKHLELHNHIANVLGFAPIAGVWAALDPENPTEFLPHIVQNALGLTNAQQLARITALRNGLQAIGYDANFLSAIIASPAGKTEDDLIRAIVRDLGFTMRDLANASINIL